MVRKASYLSSDVYNGPQGLCGRLGVQPDRPLMGVGFPKAFQQRGE